MNNQVLERIYNKICQIHSKDSITDTCLAYTYNKSNPYVSIVLKTSLRDMKKLFSVVRYF